MENFSKPTVERGDWLVPFWKLLYSENTKQMHISIAKFGGSENVLTVEIASDLSLKDLKAVIEAESDFAIKAEEMSLYFEGKLLGDDNQTLEQCKFNDYDLLTCQRASANHGLRPEPAATSRRNMNPRDPRQLFEMIRSNPEMLQQIRQNSPQLVDAVQRGDFNRFMQHIAAESPEMQQRMELDRLASLDPFDPEVQRRIHEIINMQNVQENMEHAVEHAPEVFGHVIMLYINCKVNGHLVKAFVDSGAQMTIMSKACAERCGIMRLVDRRFSGIAKGVGTQKILGRIHLAQLEIEKNYFATSLSVLEDQPMDMLLGLDMLRRHQCVLDLHKNTLRIGNAVETNFLSESELPIHAKLSGNTPDIEDDISNSTTENNSQTRMEVSTTASSTPSPFPEDSIKHITKGGFTREQAIEELKLANGDATKALVSLMTKSLSIPKRKR
ncbi:unnamed protein product [Rotaria magnacalcarata]|uniref:Uncharacterized protein n=3 Tax=Rotaria magnacalcarata TaxID=392030 RepID=A0A8S2RZI3_9BILA|nr:unnamed protein product [Rotaria magnacalcarata]